MFDDSDEDEEISLEEEYGKDTAETDREEENDLEEYGEDTAETDSNTIPRYYVLSPDLTTLSSVALHSRPPSFQLVDFTCSFHYTHASLNPEAHIGTPLDYAPPEAHLPDLLRHLYSPASDMWSFGCVLFQLFHGQVLLDTYTLSNRRLPVKYYFDVIRSLGKEDPIPEVFHKALLSYLPQMNRYSTGIQREVLERLGEFYEEDWPRECQNLTYRGKMRERLAELRERKMKEEGGWEHNEVDVICNIIEGCVRWDPENRWTAKQVVETLEKLGIRS
jgi:serine/threonine protein kinase